MSTHTLLILFHHAKSQANLGRYPSQGLGKGMRAKHTCGAKPDWVVTVTVVCGFTPLSAIILLLDLSPTFHLMSKTMSSACFFNLLSSSAAPLSPLHWQVAGQYVQASKEQGCRAQAATIRTRAQVGRDIQPCTTLGRSGPNRLVDTCQG